MSASTLGKPGVALPADLSDSMREDCERHPYFDAALDRVTGERTACALIIPDNNPYWHGCAWELGAEPSILHALSHATKHLTANVFHKIGQRGIDRKWLEHLSGPDARAWVRERAAQTGLTQTTILKRAGASFDVYRDLMRRWSEQDARRTGGAAAPVVAAESHTEGETG